jgi:outer membrane protein assembly factor BamB
VYARSGDGTLFALHADGRRRWTTDIGALPAKLGPAPLIGPDSYAYLASYHSSMLYLVQPGGFFQWAYNAGARTLVGAAVGVDGVIFFGTADGKFRALDRELVEQWTFESGGPVISSPAIGRDGAIYFLIGSTIASAATDQSFGVGQSHAGLVAVDRQGRKLWSAPPCWESGAPLLWPAIASDGRVQVANCALSREGKLLWKAPISGPWATPAALDADGNAYFGSGSVLASVGADGSPRWSFAADGQVGPPSLGAFGAVAFSSRSADRVYVLGR